MELLHQHRPVHEPEGGHRPRVCLKDPDPLEHAVPAAPAVGEIVPGGLPQGLGKVPLSRIAEDVLADVERPKTEAEWEDFPWTLTALLTFHKDLAGVAAKPSETKRKLDGLALDTIGYLEGAQAFLFDGVHERLSWPRTVRAADL